MKRYRSSFVKCVVTLACVAAAAPVFAGPPLLCHPFNIGSAATLPWIDSDGWTGTRPDYKLDNLVADTEALLTPSTPVVVRMETLRRAALYASTDPRVANNLLKRLISRAEASEVAGQIDALAYLDAAYLAGAFNEIAMLARSKEWETRGAVAKSVVGGIDAYAFVMKSVSVRPNDPAIQFAAALIASDGHRGEYAGHAARARAGAESDALLARNLDHVQ